MEEWNQLCSLYIMERGKWRAQSLFSLSMTIKRNQIVFFFVLVIFLSAIKSEYDAGLVGQLHCVFSGLSPSQVRGFQLWLFPGQQLSTDLKTSAASAKSKNKSFNVWCFIARCSSNHFWEGNTEDTQTVLPIKPPSCFSKYTIYYIIKKS